MPSSCRVRVNAVSGVAAEAGALHCADAEAAQGDVLSDVTPAVPLETSV